MLVRASRSKGGPAESEIPNAMPTEEPFRDVSQVFVPTVSNPITAESRIAMKENGKPKKK